MAEPALSRDHTERMLRYLGASVSSSGLTASIEPEPRLSGKKIRIPGDISSAAYFIAAAFWSRFGDSSKKCGNQSHPQRDAEGLPGHGSGPDSAK